MTKQDYYAKYTFFDPSLPYNVHWWYNRTTDYHRHMDFYELFLPLEGGLIQYYNDQCMTLEPHTLYIIPKMQYHRIDYIRQEGNANIFNMSVSESFFEHNIATYSSSLMEAIKGKDCLYVRLEQVSYEFLLMLSRKATYDKDANQRLQATRLFLTAAATLYQACEMNDDALSQPRRYALDIKTKIDNLEYIENDVASIYEHYPLAPSLLGQDDHQISGGTAHEICLRAADQHRLHDSADFLDGRLRFSEPFHGKFQKILRNDARGIPQRTLGASPRRGRGKKRKQINLRKTREFSKNLARFPRRFFSKAY